ncbi:helix-turn-helix domain-containing protein, partial [Gloeocapsa sp. PCC 73106]|uniref:helix-turn-helix domain-containing protein n=1 Tax=Gloeocapsa sp. PCC 73106 TaxID=102232 RepID=UPI0002ACA827
MKSRYNYRVYPTIQQKTLLSQLFGCTRVVWNDALNYCQQTKANGETYPGFNHLSKKFLKEAKRSDARNWL